MKRTLSITVEGTQVVSVTFDHQSNGITIASASVYQSTARAYKDGNDSMLGGRLPAMLTAWRLLHQSIGVVTITAEDGSELSPTVIADMEKFYIKILTENTNFVNLSRVEQLLPDHSEWLSKATAVGLEYAGLSASVREAELRAFKGLKAEAVDATNLEKRRLNIIATKALIK